MFERWFRSGQRVRWSGIWAFACAVSLVGASIAEEALVRTPATEGARIYFVSPGDGETLKSPVTVVFGLAGIGVAPAGVDKESTGHHHLIVDAGLPDLSLPIPKNDHYRHFGGGHTEVELQLPPGTHTLQLLLADYRHIPHVPPVVSEKISITIE